MRRSRTASGWALTSSTTARDAPKKPEIRRRPGRARPAASVPTRLPATASSSLRVWSIPGPGAALRGYRDRIELDLCSPGTPRHRSDRPAPAPSVQERAPAPRRVALAGRSPPAPRAARSSVVEEAEWRRPGAARDGAGTPALRGRGAGLLCPSAARSIAWVGMRSDTGHRWARRGRGHRRRLSDRRLGDCAGSVTRASATGGFFGAGPRRAALASQAGVELRRPPAINGLQPEIRQPDRRGYG